MHKAFTILATVYRLNKEQKLWLIPVFVFSLPVWLLTLAIPYRSMGNLIGTQYRNIQLTVLTDQSQRLRARNIGRMIEAVCRYTPWPSKCLVQALLARMILYVYDIPHVLYIGICKPHEAGEPLASHAWLAVDRSIVTGSEGHHVFNIIATFVSDPELLSGGFS